jgi:hypothetical protein
MKAAIVSLIRYPGFLNIEYERYYNYSFKDKKVVVGLNGLFKGIKIIDNHNYHEEDEKKVRLHQPLSEFTKGHIFKIGTDTESEENWLKFSWEPDDGREVFVTENYYTDFLIIVEFEEFSEPVFRDDNKRKRYNSTIIGAFNHFISKYNVVNKGGTIFNITDLTLQSNSSQSLVLKQNFFEIKKEKDLQEYIKKGTFWNLSATSIFLEASGAHGMKGADATYIKQMTQILDKEIKNNLSPEESFISSAYQELQKGNLRYAYLEVFLAIEVSVEKFLTDRKAMTKMPDNILSDYSRETGIGYQTNVEIPLIIGEVNKDYILLIKEINKIRKIRNGIVHKGIEVDAKQVNHAIDHIVAYTNFLKNVGLKSARLPK